MNLAPSPQANLLVFLVPLQLPAGTREDWAPDAVATGHLVVALDRPDESRRLYLTDRVFGLLHPMQHPRAARWRLAKPPTSVRISGVPGLAEGHGAADLVNFDVLRIGATRLVIVGVALRVAQWQDNADAAPRAPDTDVLRAVADTWRLRGPLWDGHGLPKTSGDGMDCSLPALLKRCVPSLQPAIEDRRAFTWLYAAVAKPPSLVQRFALAAIDPPGMSPPPDDVLEHFERDRTYRRWAASGTWYGFTHYSAALVHSGDGASWLGPLMAGLYFDVATWAVAVAAHRCLTAERMRVGLSDPKHAGDALAAWRQHLATFEGVRFSEQDQGAQLARAWLEAIEAERGDLAWLRTAAREL